jgi:hypothetical protein
MNLFCASPMTKLGITFPNIALRLSQRDLNCMEQTHHLLVYADDADLMCENVKALQKRRRTFISHGSTGQNRNLVTYNETFENVQKFKYLGTTATNRNCTNEEIRGWLNSRSACCHSVQNVLSSRFLSGNSEINISLSVVLYGRETWLSYWDRNTNCGCLSAGCLHLRRNE